MPEYIKKIRTDKGDCQIDYNALANLPSSMKNPYPITFTGAVSVIYDGSTDATVEIPQIDYIDSYTKEESDSKYAEKAVTDLVIETIRSNNLFDINSKDNIPNSLININGNVETYQSTKSSVSYFISVDPGMPIKSTIDINASVYCYNDDKQYLKSFGYVNNSNPFTLAEGTKYIRVVYWPADGRNWMFYQNEEDLDYEPYFIDYKIKESALPEFSSYTKEESDSKYAEKETVDSISSEVSKIQYRKKIIISNTGNIMDFYNSMLLAYDQGDTDVYITGGQYTYTNEFVEYIRSLNKRGVPIGKNNRYFFETTAKIYCEYTGSNKIDVKGYFSPLDVQSVANSFEIHNMHLVSKNTVYAFHDEVDGATEYCKHVFENCYIELDNTAIGGDSSYISKALGGGLGQNEDVIIKNCIFKSTNPYFVDSIDKSASYHGSRFGNTNATLVITGCYLDQAFGFDETYGSSVKPVVIFCNNSYRGKIAPDPELYDAYLWNNEKRE